MSVMGSVIVCTRNRAESLRYALSALALLESVPNHEIIVVDNGSTDSTSVVIEAARKQFRVPFSVVLEPKRGQARARNRGLRHARGDILVFTDDDVWMPHDWLARLVAPIQRNECDAVVGGIRLPQSLRQDWMSEVRVAGYWCCTERFATSPPEMIGANMGFHRRVLEKVNGFDEKLGPGALGFYDDTFFGWQLQRAGFRLYHEPSAVVEHHFDDSRLTPSAVATMHKKHGQSLGYLAWHRDHRVETAPLWKMLVGIRYWLTWRLRGNLNAPEPMSAGRFWAIRHLYEKPWYYWRYWLESWTPRKYALQRPSE